MNILHAVALSGLVAMGCNTSVVPIDTVANAPFDSLLLGQWQQIDPDSGEVVLTILEFDAPVYFIEADDTSGLPPVRSEQSRVRARAFITTLSGYTFMNVDELSGRPRAYALYQFGRAGDTLTIRELTKEAHKFESSAELRRYIVANVATPSLYEVNDVRFRRVPKQSVPAPR